jgi:hypothetical protein
MARRGRSAGVGGCGRARRWSTAASPWTVMTTLPGSPPRSPAAAPFPSSYPDRTTGRGMNVAAPIRRDRRLRPVLAPLPRRSPRPGVSLRKGGGQVDAPGRGRVGANTENPHDRPNLPAIVRERFAEVLGFCSLTAAFTVARDARSAPRRGRPGREPRPVPRAATGRIPGLPRCRSHRRGRQSRRGQNVRRPFRKPRYTLARAFLGRGRASSVLLTFAAPA